MPKFMASYATDQNVVGFSDVVYTALRNKSSIFTLIQRDAELGDNKAASAVWFDDYNGNPQTLVNAAHLVGDTVITVLDSAPFQVNDIVHFGVSGSNELALVTAKPSGTQITVTRGYRATTATALAVGNVVMKVEYGTLEGATAPQAFTSGNTAKRENYFQTISATYGLSAEALNSRTWGEGEREQKLAREGVRAIEQLKESISRALFYNVKNLGSSTQFGAFDGLRAMIANAGGSIVNVGGQLTEAALNDRIDQLVANGGNPDVVFVNPAVLGPITTAGASRQATNRSEEIIGMKALMFQSRSYGEIAIIREQSLAVSDAVIMEWDKLGLSYREDWVDEEVGRVGNQTNRLIRAQLCPIFRNAAASGLWLTGVTV